MAPNNPNRFSVTRGPGRNPSPGEVRQLRAEMDLTRPQLGALVYASARTVDAWENGQRRMPPITWELLCMIRAYPEVERSQNLWRAGRAF
jgi:DNA-binding transcriptional regulator YiaG